MAPPQIQRYDQQRPESDDYLEKLIKMAGAYVTGVMDSERQKYSPEDNVKAVIETLIAWLKDGGHDEEEIQTQVFSIAKENELAPKELFSAVYRLLSGQPSGPRLGSFIHLMGEAEVASRLSKALTA